MVPMVKGRGRDLTARSSATYTGSHDPEMSSRPKRLRNNTAEDEPVYKEQNTRLSPEPQISHDWLPLTLRPSYLAFLIVSSLILSATIFYLTAKSSRAHGICNDNNTAITFFSWRFLPTLIATIYSLLVATMVNDVRRTEIFARLSRPRGASAAHTICMPIRSWWNDPSDAWSRKKNDGKRSWAMLSATTINLLALLVVSPLSAILLFPANTQFTALTAFNKMHEVQDLITSPAASEMVTFRTTIAAVLNQSTSAWVSTEYAVVPFWPSTFGEPPMGAIITGLSPQNWSSRATVYQVELECVPMSLLQTGNVTWTENLLSDTTEAFSNITYEAATSDDGCSIVFSGVPEDRGSLGSRNTHITANQTFGIFFKHFVTFNLSENQESYAYEPPDYFRKSYDPIDANISTPIEELRMSPAAAILSMSILIFLIITTIILYFANRKEYKAIPRDVDTLASTLGWVYASDRLLTWTEHAPPSQPWYKYLLSDPSSVGRQRKAKMGFFMDSHGTQRWGIELIDVELTTAILNTENRDGIRNLDCATEDIELRDYRSSDSTGFEVHADLDVRERLLRASEAEVEANGGAEERLQDTDHDSRAEDDRVSLVPSQISKTSNSSSQQ